MGLAHCCWSPSRTCWLCPRCLVSRLRSEAMSEQMAFTNHVYIGPTPESRAAALRVYGITGALRLAVFDCISRYSSGRTDLEIQENLNMDGSTERPRRR